VTEVATLHRSLEQELFAILRGASYECPICGEFLLHRADGSIGCPECGAQLGSREAGGAALPFVSQAG
jgi:predicted RNA-binding Zn-ribbon protein involved in translation (DUF1610 family)